MIHGKQIIFLPCPVMHISKSRRGAGFCRDFSSWNVLNSGEESIRYLMKLAADLNCLAP